MTVEEYAAYELPTVETFRQRLAGGKPLLEERDKDALSLPFEEFYYASRLEPCVVNLGYCDEMGLLPRFMAKSEAEARRNKRQEDARPLLEQGRSRLNRLSAELAELADTYGAEAKALAFDFRRVECMIDSEDMEKICNTLEELYENTDDFSKRCFTGEAKPEPPMADTEADKTATDKAATPLKKSRAQDMEITQKGAADAITRVLKGVEWHTGKRGRVLRWKGGKKNFMTVRQLRNIEKGAEGADLWKRDLRYPGRASKAAFDSWIKYLLPDLARYMVGYWEAKKAVHDAASFESWMRARMKEEHEAEKRR